MASGANRLLVVETEPLLRITVADALRKEGWTVDVAEDGLKGSTLFDHHQHDVVLSDLVMPRMGGIELLKRIIAQRPETAVFIMTAHATVDRAVEAMRAGAADFIAKPFSIAQLLVRLSGFSAARLAREQNAHQQERLERKVPFSRIIGESRAMQEVFELVRLVAVSDTPVLLYGEGGTGKELVASAIHLNSPRRAKPYVRVSCGAIPDGLVEAELFGHEKGAFTGATERRIGRFEAATGGTLFLDEIGELPLPFQVKLLRAMQDRQMERLGSNRPLDVDVRIVSASPRSLEEAVDSGSFRADLYFRVNTVAINLPPLRDRKEDIPILAQNFLGELTWEQGRQIEGFSDDVLELFDLHPWPGNVRELRSVIERAVLFCRGTQITIEELPPKMRRKVSKTRRPVSKQVSTLKLAVERAEADAVRAALAATQGRRSDAAGLLGVSRKTLWEKIKHHGIESDS
jgi:two-component system response regulator HydG